MHKTHERSPTQISDDSGTSIVRSAALIISFSSRLENIYESEEEARRGTIASLISLSGQSRFVELIPVYHISQKY